MTNIRVLMILCVMTRKEQKRAYLYILPSLFLAVLFCYYPFLRTIVSSFFTIRFNGEISSFAGLSNYRKLFSSDEFRQSIRNTFFFMLLFVPANTLIILSASLLCEKKRKESPFLETVFLLPMAVALSASALIFRFLLDPSLGIVNSMFHLDIPWKDNAFWAMVSLVLLGIYLDFGLDFILLLSALRNSDRNIIDAAKLDGAGGLRLILAIKLPLIRETLSFVTFIAIKDALLIVAPVMLLTEGGPFRSTETVAYYYYIQAFKNSNHALGSASSTIILALSLIPLLCYARIGKKDKGVL